MTNQLPVHSPPQYMTVEERSEKSRLLAVALGIFFGYWGLHRFYTGKVWTGLLMFFTGGGFLIWWFIDALLLMSGRFKDSEGKVLGPPAKVAYPQQRLEAQPLDRLEDRHRTVEEDEEVKFDDLFDDPLEEEFRKLAESEAGKSK